MILIKPSYHILSKIDSTEILKNIERAGRTCYKSEDKITKDSSFKFVEMIIKRGHESVLEHEKLSVLFICDRGVSHELVRHRIASFSQESTRYCNYSKKQITYIIPEWCKSIKAQEIDSSIVPGFIYLSEIEGEFTWLKSMMRAENYYNELIKENWKPEQARSVLPNSLKTEIVVTANLREWRLIFKQRSAIVAHPQMRELMIPLLAEVKNLIPVIFQDL